MKKKVPYLFAADTESTQPRSVDDIPDFKTVPWALGYAPVSPLYGTREVKCFNRLRNFLDGIKKDTPSGYHAVVYFHNLAWDGMILLSILMQTYGFRNTENKYHPGRNEFKVLISDKGQWYKMEIIWKGFSIEFRDSLKILPIKLEKLCKDFGVKHQKLVGTIDYTIQRDADWVMTETERKYFENDILGLAECLAIAEYEGLTQKLTIGANCLDQYKKMMGKKFDVLFPQLDSDLDTAIRKSYRGGWCYVNSKNENKVLNNIDGYVYDVNSLYPYSMHSNVWDGDRKHVFPVGYPVKHLLNPSQADLEKYKELPGFYRMNVSFKIKENHLPFIQIKRSVFRDNEYLTDSKGPQEITLTKEDFVLMQEQYYIDYLDIEEAWLFNGREGIFDCYIDYWFKEKEQATITGNKSKRAISKLFLNNLYGKMSTSPDGNGKIPAYDKRTEKITWVRYENEKDTLYIPAGAYITAYARGKTVRAAQRNYDIFDYADTDSLHCHGKATGLVIDDVKLGAWANESQYNAARYVRQKTYIEHITVQDGKPVVPFFDIKAAGAPQSVKERMQYKVDIDKNLTYSKDDLDHKHPLNEKYSISEMLNRFTFGLVESGKMAKKTVSGGSILYNTTFEIRPL